MIGLVALLLLASYLAHKIIAKKRRIQEHSRATVIQDKDAQRSNIHEAPAMSQSELSLGGRHEALQYEMM